MKHPVFALVALSLLLIESPVAAMKPPARLICAVNVAAEKLNFVPVKSPWKDRAELLRLTPRPLQGRNNLVDDRSELANYILLPGVSEDPYAVQEQTRNMLELPDQEITSPVMVYDNVRSALECLGDVAPADWLETGLTLLGRLRPNPKTDNYQDLFAIVAKMAARSPNSVAIPRFLKIAAESPCTRGVFWTGSEQAVASTQFFGRQIRALLLTVRKGIAPAPAADHVVILLERAISAYKAKARVVPQEGDSYPPASYTELSNAQQYAVLAVDYFRDVPSLFSGWHFLRFSISSARLGNAVQKSLSRE